MINHTRRVSATLGILSMLACSESAIIDPPTPTVASVSIVQSDVSFTAIGEALTLEARALSANGSLISGATLEWSVGTNGIVTVDAVSGLLTARGNGTDTVRVSTDGLFDVIQVSVEQVPTAIRLTGIAPFSWAGASAALPRTVTDSRGFNISGITLVWTSSDPAVAAVNEAGRATAVSSGSAVITAVLGAIAGTASVSVNFDGPIGGPITGATEACNAGIAANLFDCDRMDLLSYLPISALGGVDGIHLNDMWGWTDTQTGFEYALVGRGDGVSFVDISDPNNPRYIGHLGQTPGSPESLWRDIKVYKDHAFIVADASGFHGLQVVDLTQLRNFSGVPKILLETAHYSGFGSAHNIAINEETGFAYVVGAHGGGENCGGGLHMIDITTPASPTFAGCFADPLTGRSGTGYSHDVQCVVYTGPDPDHQGSELCFGFNETAISIADVSDKNNPFPVSRATYPKLGYTHQGWVTDDQRYLYVNDELDELSGLVELSRTLVWDVVDIDNPILVAEYLGPSPAIDHNLYVKGDLLYTANYQFGMRVVDISDRENPVERAFFDTAPTEPDVAGWNGAWTAYPFFDSGTVAVTSQAEGLFLLRLK